MGAEPVREMEAFENEGAAAPPESWELADLEESMKKLLAPSKVQVSDPPLEKIDISSSDNGDGLAESINQVDQFLRDALQNPRDRLTILRMEQLVEKFIQNPSQQQLEFEQLPTSYLRLVAHRVAQHYYLQSMVVIDHYSADGSGSKIIARKTCDSRYPAIRLADIPVNLPQDEKTSAVKFEIKQRTQKGSQIGDRHSSSMNSCDNLTKSVEERKEEYNKARARIFNSSYTGDLGGTSGEEEFGALDYEQCCSIGAPKPEGKHNKDHLQNNHAKGLSDSSSGACRINNSKGEREPNGRVKTNNGRVAIFRDREKDRKDPDYNRSYDRYHQRFDPGFGLNLGPFSMQAVYAPPVNYNTEFPQLGAQHRAQIHMELPPHSVATHGRGPWVPPQSTMGYGPPDAMMRPFNPGHMGAHSASSMYLQSSQFACPSPAMTYVHPHECFQQSLAHPHVQHQPESSFGQARRH